MLRKPLKNTLLAVSMTLSLSANAIEPSFGTEFNFNLPGVELASLNHENFHDVLVPLAKEEKSLNFFDFSGSLGPIFTDVAIPSFEKKYGIKVNYYKVDGNVATQQVIASQNANRDATVDLFFVGSGGTLNSLDAAKAMANIPYHQLLPNLQDAREDIATAVNGVQHGGAYAPFHLNQVSMAYNSRRIDEQTIPTTFDELLAYAKANPMKVAITSPSRGGSGSGFAMSASMTMMSDECLDEAHDFSRTEAQAAEWAKACGQPVVDYYNELKPVVEFTNGNADTLNLLANSQVYMGSAWEDMTYTYLNQSLLPRTIRQVVLEPGLVGGADGIMIPHNAANKASALLFLNELLSSDTQIEKVQRIGSRSPRTSIDFSNEVPQNSMQFLIPSDNLEGRQQNWYNKLYTNALAEHLTLKVLAN